MPTQATVDNAGGGGHQTGSEWLVLVAAALGGGVILSVCLCLWRWFRGCATATDATSSHLMVNVSD